jgi:hypothetical protein
MIHHNTTVIQLKAGKVTYEYPQKTFISSGPLYILKNLENFRTA